MYDSFDISDWKNTDINVDSLWIIEERDKRGKHSNIYHGNFIPQIPNQLIRRYTNENDLVLDIFMGSGTTLFECEKLNRNFIGFDINTEIINFVQSKMMDNKTITFSINECDVTNKDKFDKAINYSLAKQKRDTVDFLIAHPPYMDIVKFTDKEEDLSKISDLNLFVEKFIIAINNAINYLKINKYLAIVIGDIYKKSEVIPLGFHLIAAIKSSFNVKLKGIIEKNIEGKT